MLLSLKSMYWLFAFIRGLKVHGFLQANIISLVLSDLVKELQNLKDPRRAEVSAWFFKTGPGQYGEGDVFLGITVPDQRKVAKKYLNLSFADIKKLLVNKIHEYRLVGLLILVENYKKTDEVVKKKIYDFYVLNLKYVNNWDLVDLSADYILGDYLLNHQRSLLYKLSRSVNLWERRVAIVATYRFIKNNRFSDTLKIAALLIDDDHDLIHKAVGWMLREVGKRDQMLEEKFLQKYYKIMPRTMLRYAIERFDEAKRKHYLEK